MINLILCGGSGTRLWPISRTLLPKQFVKFLGGKSLFQETIERNRKSCSSQFIISNVDQYFLAYDQLEDLSETENAKFLLEPVGRNTAPAIALACLKLAYDDIVLVSSSDHMIKDIPAYNESLQKAREFAENDHLVTFGIKATYPEVGYGYIESNGDDVIKFHEKPDLDRAKEYIDKGNYHWNSGMFCFKAGVFLDELKKHSESIYENSKIALNNSKSINGNDFRIVLDDMVNIPDKSVDYAVMEKSDNVKVVFADMGWSDLGSFDALYDEVIKDKNGNAVITSTNNDESNQSIINPITIDSTNNLIVGSNRMISTIDIDNLIIVDTPDALLVSKKGSSQKVKQIVSKIKDSNSDLHNIHLTVHRPWGTYTVLEEGKQYKLKKIVVKPGKRLSLQKHFHRNEHWVVVDGVAHVVVGDEKKFLRTNESTYIQMGENHRLENPGKIDLVLIEVQVGAYIDENDIIRTEDDFNRL